MGFTDEEVFGSTPQATAPPAASPKTGGYSDEEVFGATAAPTVGPVDRVRAPVQDASSDTMNPLLRYPLEAIKSQAQGATNLAGTALEGASALSRGFDKRQLDFMRNIDRGQEPTLKRGESWFTVDPYGYRDMSPEQRQQFRASNQQSMETPAEKRPVFQAGKAVEDLATGPLKNAPGHESGLWHDLNSGFGSMVAGIGLSMVPVVGPYAAGATFVGSGAGQQYEDAKKKGATEDQALRAASLGTAAGATDLADALLPTLGTPGKALSLIKRVGLRAFEGAFIEGGQEGVQQFAQNLIAKGIYNPSQDLSEDVAYNALIGAILGGGVTGTLGGHGGPDAPASETDINKAFDDNSGPLSGPPGVPTDVSGRAKIGTPLPPPVDAKTGVPVSPTQILPTAQPPVDEQMRSDGLFISPEEQLGAVPSGMPQTFGLPPAEVTPSSISPEVMDFLSKQAPPLTANPVEAALNEREQQNPGSLRDEATIKTTPGVNTARLARLLGSTLYGDPANMSSVTVKEMFQNAFDAVKAVLENKTVGEGKIDIEMDQNSRSILIRDNGEGMPPSIMGKEFLQIAGTKKQGSRPSGGLGIAKMLILYGNKNLRVMSLRDGKIYEMNTSGPELHDSLEDPNLSPSISVRTPTAEDRSMFPDGHGTLVKVEIPTHYPDPSTGELKDINFTPEWWDQPVLSKSPLFDNISVTFNGHSVPGMGSAFDHNGYTQFANVNFSWGTARIYASKEPLKYTYASNLHVLSNGLWQFDGEIKKNPLEMFGENVPVDFYVDINPKVTPDEPGYPFSLDRQNFSKSVLDDFGKIFRYMSAVYHQADLTEDMENFGDMQYLTANSHGQIVVGARQKIQPNKPPTETPVSRIKPGDTVKVEDGKLIVNGRQVPELTKEELEKFRINPDELRVPQEQIISHQVILHDNMEITLSPLEKKSFVDYARSRHGQRFDEFVFKLGNAFRELRDIVAQTMSAPPIEAVEGTQFTKVKKILENSPRFKYDSMRKEGIGISFDPAYRGVSITVPFQGSFINPILTEYDDPVKAGVGVVGTMIHELAHHKERNHDAKFPAEMQRILIHLHSNTAGFNYHAFLQKVVNIYANYENVYRGLRSDVLSGNFDIQPRGKRFKSSGSNEAGDGSVARDVATDGNGAEGVSGLRQWVALGQTIPEAQPGSARPIGQVSGTSGNVDPVGSQAANAAAFQATGNPGTAAAPRQPETQAIYDSVTAAVGGPGRITPEIREYAAHADRMNWWYKWMAGLDQLVRANMRFIPLLKYYAGVREMHNDEARIHDASVRVLKEWRHLGAQSENLTAFIDDLANMRYRTADEVKRGINRQPTRDEFNKLAKARGMTKESLAVYAKVKNMFDTFLRLVQQNSIDTAQRMIKDPVKLAQRIDEINAMVTKLQETPYFPFINFGRHYVRATDAKGHSLHFETFQRSGFKSAERQQLDRYNELVKTYGANNVKYGLLPEASTPFLGMPSSLLSDIKNDPNIGLSPAQKTALDELVYVRVAQNSFAARFKNKRYIPGYSKDFQRAFAKYFFHGARYYARQKYAWRLRDAISAAQTAMGNKANSIADYMRDHMQNTVLDYSGDFGLLKGFIFFYALGYVPAAATQNLTQTPMITYPFLSAKFGDIRATREITKAMTKLSSYYRRGTYDNMTDFEARALGYGIKTGRLTETQAPELAGLSQGANLIHGLGGNAIQRGFQHLQEGSSWMFETAEQFNRRVAYRAALNLALQNPNAKFVQESLNLGAEEYHRLIAEGFSPPQAKAILAAANAVDQTQYVYARYARPRFMRGKLPGTLFVFKKYMQSTLFMLGQNKSDVLPRYLIVAAALGGIGGFPGYDDLKTILQAIGAWLFKSHFNLDQEIRQYVTQFTNGKVDSDLVLHGLSRRGFGLPALVDMMGEAPGRGLTATRANNVPFPVVDRSRALGMGNILPVDLGKMLTPTNEAEKEIAKETQQASGAVFSVGFNMYKALQDQKNDASDLKRWEHMMPRALANASRSYRAFSEGRERGRGGPQSASTVLNYDVRDNEQMMEALALAAGYQPLRLQAKWDTIMAKAEVEKFYDLRRSGLLQQLFEAQFGKDPKEIESVAESIRRFNTELPEWARGRAITADTASKSMQTRALDKAKREAGVPLQTSNAGISRYIDTLFPEAKTMEIKQVR